MPAVPSNEGQGQIDHEPLTRQDVTEIYWNSVKFNPAERDAAAQYLIDDSLTLEQKAYYLGDIFTRGMEMRFKKLDIDERTVATAQAVVKPYSGGMYENEINVVAGLFGSIGMRFGLRPRKIL